MLELYGSVDFSVCAKTHLLQVMQRQAFSKELEFLSNPSDKLVPDLVNNLNLFLDKDGLIRCDGRIGKTTYFDQSIINPVLLAKDHCLTKLIIEQCHLNVKHLGIQSCQMPNLHKRICLNSGKISGSGICSSCPRCCSRVISST